MSSDQRKKDFKEFSKLVEEYRYDFDKLVYIIFPYGEKDSELEHCEPYPWQLERWRKMSAHLKNPKTRYETYREIISTGNGSGKTAYGAQTALMLLYTQRLRGRITANNESQLQDVIWAEYEIWFRRARFAEELFEKMLTKIYAKDPKMSQKWTIHTFIWNKDNPAAVSGLHNKGGAVLYVFEEAPAYPKVVFTYARGAFTETETIKIHLAFGNSDDPDSHFETLMRSKVWNSLRIDCRDLEHMDKNGNRKKTHGVWRG